MLCLYWLDVVTFSSISVKVDRNLYFKILFLSANLGFILLLYKINFPEKALLLRCICKNENVSKCSISIKKHL